MNSIQTEGMIELKNEEFSAVSGGSLGRLLQIRKWFSSDPEGSCICQTAGEAINNAYNDYPGNA